MGDSQISAPRGGLREGDTVGLHRKILGGSHERAKRERTTRDHKSVLQREETGEVDVVIEPRTNQSDTQNGVQVSKITGVARTRAVSLGYII